MTVHDKCVLHLDIFRDFIKMEIGLWLEIYLDYLALASDLYVIHYENVKADTENQIRGILHHLEIPVNEDRMDCTINNPQEKFKRKKLEYESPFDDELHQLIEKAMLSVNELLKKRNQETMPFHKYKWVRKEFLQKYA